MPTLENISDELVQVLNEVASKNEAINYRDMASRFMCEIIGEVAFGLKCKIQKLENIFTFNESNYCRQCSSKSQLRDDDSERLFELQRHETTSYVPPSECVSRSSS